MGVKSMKTSISKGYYFPELHFRGDWHILAMQPQLHCSLKLDGEKQSLVVNHGTDARLYNKVNYGRMRWDCPITKEAVNLPSGTYLGELYDNPKDVYTLLRAKTSDKLCLSLWDVIEFERQNIQNYPYSDRRVILENLGLPTFPANFPLSIVPEWITSSAADLEALATKIFSQNYEGLVLRLGSSTYFDGTTSLVAKLKKEYHETLWVWGYSKQAKILSLLIGNDQKPLAHCGSGLTFEEKESVRQVLKQHIIGQTKSDFLTERRLQIKVKHYGYIRNEAGEVNSLRMPIFENFVF